MDDGLLGTPKHSGALETVLLISSYVEATYAPSITISLRGQNLAGGRYWRKVKLMTGVCEVYVEWDKS